MLQLLCLAVSIAGCITFNLKSHIAGVIQVGEWNNRGRTGPSPKLAGAMTAEQQPCSESSSRTA